MAVDFTVHICVFMFKESKSTLKFLGNSFVLSWAVRVFEILIRFIILFGALWLKNIKGSYFSPNLLVPKYFTFVIILNIGITA